MAQLNCVLNSGRLSGRMDTGGQLHMKVLLVGLFDQHCQTCQEFINDGISRPWVWMATHGSVRDLFVLNKR